jgi:hypothetical protein
MVIDAARLKIRLLDIEPEPWREIEVPLSMTLRALHDTIQTAFLWTNSHLWQFEIAEKTYGIPFDDNFGDETMHNAEHIRLTLLRDRDISEFLYLYDMGDGWEHHIEVVELSEMSPGTRLPRFLGGQWRRPPEDVGGAPGFEYFLEVMADPDHEEHGDLMDWHGGPFERDNMEPEQIEILMKRLANRH